jgi:hypothetical protein
VPAVTIENPALYRYRRHSTSFLAEAQKDVAARPDPDGAERLSTTRTRLGFNLTAAGGKLME